MLLDVQNQGKRRIMASQEDVALRPMLVLPSRTRKYVRLTPEQAYEALMHLLRENAEAGSIQGKEGKTPSIRAKLGGWIGVTVKLEILPEGDVSSLEFRFSYRSLLFASIVVLVTVIGLSLVLRTPVPAVGSALILAIAFTANSVVVRFLDTVNMVLPHIEREYARRALLEDRRRWESEPKDTAELFRRLSEKHNRTWGNTNVLLYKIKEYERQGLMHNEAVRKIAEEEGIS